MSFFIKQIVTHRIRRITTKEILEYAIQYRFSITKRQAEQIEHVLQTTDFNPLSIADHKRLFQKLQHITDADTAKKAEQLLNHLLTENGFDQYLQP